MERKCPESSPSGDLEAKGSIGVGAAVKYEDWLRGIMLPKYAKAFPKAFSTNKSKVRPLALGIVREITDKGNQELSSFVFKFLRWYCTRPCYLKAVMDGIARVHLDGRYAGDVTVKEKDYSATRFIAEMKKRGLIKS